jgi:hypothetical protein
MRIDGLDLIEGSTITNAVIANGASFPVGPANTPNDGELFFKTDNVDTLGVRGLYIYDASAWKQVADTTALNAITALPTAINAGTVYPSTPVNGELFYDTAASSLFYYDEGNTQWVVVNSPLDADLTAIAALAGTLGILTKTGANTWSLDTTTYEPDLGTGTTGQFLRGDKTWQTVTMPVIGTDVQAWDADLDAISALVGTTGILRKTAANTWALDTTVYISGNESISVSGDATGSGTTAISLTLANSGVTAATYGSGTEIPVIAVDAKGRITSASTVTVDTTAEIKGGGTDAVFIENDQVVTTDYTITTGRNAGSFGPVSVDNGIVVTIPNGSVWTIV